MANTGIRTVFPLWQKPTKSLVLDLIKSGMRAVITSVDLTALPASFLGRELTVALIEEVIGLGCDPCGENGEYHSFVFDGPLFNYRVCFERGEPRIGKDFAHLPLAPRTPTLSIDDVRSNLSTTGFAVVPSDKFVATLQDTSSCLVRLANAFRSTHAEVRDVPNLTTLREVLATELSQNDAAAHAVVEQVLETAHESIVQVRDDIVPALAKLARRLGFDVDLQRAIARFRIATSSQSDYDHLWHQDSVDPPSVSNRERTLNLGFWIPLHDVGSDEGTLEFALGSHVQPIPHPDTDACGRLCVPKERVQQFKKRVVSVCYGNMLAFDAWVAHRTVANTSKRIRIALLVWF